MRRLKKIQFEILSCLEKGEREDRKLTLKWMNQRYPSEHTKEAMDDLEQQEMIESIQGGYTGLRKGKRSIGTISGKAGHHFGSRFWREDAAPYPECTKTFGEST